MLEENAVVVAVEGNDAWVETQRQSVCGTCSVNKGCGTSVIAKVFGDKRTRIKTRNAINARPGDQVILGLQPQALVRGSLAMYFVPLLSMFVTAALGALLVPQWTEYSEGWRIIFSLLGLAAGFVWLRNFSTKTQNDSRYQASILRFASSSSVQFVRTSS